MSSGITPATPATPPTSNPASAQTQETPQELRIVSHSPIFYWWPVWAFGFLMALITWSEQYFMVVVPAGTKAQKEEVQVEGKKGEVKTGTRYAWVLPEGRKVPLVDPTSDKSAPLPPYIHVSNHKTPGVIFAAVLLLVIVITNITLRGMWSVLVIIGTILVFLILHLMDLLPWLATLAGYLDVRINLAGYLVISGVLFLIWFATVVFFDRRVYIVFSARQVRVCTEIGAGEKVYDAIGLTLEKQPSDLFRHWILGLGAGDLVVRTSGAQAHIFDLPNVLFIRAKMKAIERLVQRQDVKST